MGGGRVAYAGSPDVSSATDGSCGGPVLRAGSLVPRGAALLLRMCERGGREVIGTNGKPELAVREKGVTPARRAISCSPICQCIASAARHGMDISSAILDHMSALNLMHWNQQDLLVPRCSTYLSYNLASLFLRSSSHSLRLSR
jgi:hypothetical protein